MNNAAFYEVCANCGKPYADHLLWDGNKCSPGSINGWFSKAIADALSRITQPDAIDIPVAPCVPDEEC